MEKYGLSSAFLLSPLTLRRRPDSWEADKARFIRNPSLKLNNRSSGSVYSKRSSGLSKPIDVDLDADPEAGKCESEPLDVNESVVSESPPLSPVPEDTAATSQARGGGEVDPGRSSRILGALRSWNNTASLTASDFLKRCYQPHFLSAVTDNLYDPPLNVPAPRLADGHRYRLDYDLEQLDWRHRSFRESESVPYPDLFDLTFYERRDSKRNTTALVASDPHDKENVNTGRPVSFDFTKRDTPVSNTGPPVPLNRLSLCPPSKPLLFGTSSILNRDPSLRTSMPLRTDQKNRDGPQLERTLGMIECSSLQDMVEVSLREAGV